MEKEIQNLTTPESNTQPPTKLQNVLTNMERALRSNFERKGLDETIETLNLTITNAWGRVQQLFAEGGRYTNQNTILLKSEMDKMNGTMEGKKILDSNYTLTIDSNTAACLEIGLDSNEKPTVYKRVKGYSKPIKSEGYLNAIERYFTRQISEHPASNEAIIEVLDIRNNIALEAISQAIDDHKRKTS